jgi:hypothetical protein
MIRFSLGLIGVIMAGGVVDSAPLWYIPALAIPSLLLMAWPILDGTVSE